MEPTWIYPPWVLYRAIDEVLEFVLARRTRFSWQAGRGHTTAAMVGDVQVPKEKPRPPCEAVYKTNIETR